MLENSLLTFNIFKPLPGFIHGFSTREMDGGSSLGPFYNLNLGNFQFDEKARIMHNRLLFFKRFYIDPARVAYARQIHSGNVQVIDRPGSYDNCDALITRQKNIYLTVQTADCFPLFVIEPAAKIVALIHAGWRGVVRNIVEHSIEKMVSSLDAEPSRMVAAIGPGLRSECFEVKSDVFKQIPAAYCFSHAENIKRYIDLAGFITEKLIALGLNFKNIEVSTLCTRCRSDLFFSYRRDGIKSGRMMGLLGIC